MFWLISIQLILVTYLFLFPKSTSVNQHLCSVLTQLYESELKARSWGRLICVRQIELLSAPYNILRRFDKTWKKAESDFINDHTPLKDVFDQVQSTTSFLIIFGFFGGVQAFISQSPPREIS